MISCSWLLSIIFSLIGVPSRKKEACDFNDSYMIAFVYIIVPLIFLTIIILCVRITYQLKNRKFGRKFELNATTLLLISIAIACVLWIPGIITYAFYRENRGNEEKLFGYLFLYYAHPIINTILYGYAIYDSRKRGALKEAAKRAISTSCCIKAVAK